MSSKFVRLSDRLQKGRIDLPSFLPIAIETCKHVYALHQQNRLHGHLSPSEISVNTALEVKISDPLSAPSFGTLPYIAPEQVVTGSKSINASSEIYILGIIFYEMFSAKLPYTCHDPLEFHHTIVTRKVPFLSEQDKNIPLIVSKIVEKMVAINQSERYQDLLSVSIDLTKVLQSIKTKDDADDFAVDTFGNLSGIHTSSTLYGREKEQRRLQLHIDAKNDRSNIILLVSGISGVGKSSIVETVIKKNREAFSHICSFKLDYGEQSTPYQKLYSALRLMTRQLIAQDEETLLHYKKRMQTLLGSNVRLLQTVIPEMVTILGASIPENQNGAVDTNVSFDNLLVRYMEVFVDPRKPLCIYIDDMQWADSVIMQWIKSVLLELDNIMLFLTYRKDETGVANNPLFTSMLHEFASYELKIDDMEIGPLAYEDIRTLVRDSVALDASDEIARIIYERTKGNPFFVKQYLKQLQLDNAIWFDMDSLTWQYDLNKIDSLQVSDNVFDMLSDCIDLLPANVRDLLCIASCMGNEFTYDLLQKVYNDDETFEASMASALSSGWIIEDLSGKRDTKSYRFLHDKMQETINTFLLGKMLGKVHYKIGCEMEKERNTRDNHNLILCVNHLNIGSMYVRDKVFLGRLNVEASIDAKRSGDFKSALGYIKKAMELFFLNTSMEEAILMLKLRAECEHLCNYSSEAIIYYEKALELATHKWQRGEIYELLIKLYSDISNFNKAYEVGRIATSEFGVEIPKKFIPPKFIVEFLRLKLKLRRYKTEELIDLPPSQDEEFKMLIRLMANTLQAAYQIRPELCVANAMIIVRLCLERGLTKESAIGFTVFGVIFQGGILGNHQTGYNYSHLSYAMLERFDNTTQHAEVKFVSGYFGASWKQPAAETEELWNAAYKNGLEIGDWFHTGCAAAGIVQSMFMRGVAFEDILEKIRYFEKVLLSIGAKEQHGAIMSVKQTIRNLTGQTRSQLSYDSDDFSESSFEQTLEQYASKHFALYYFVDKMIALYMHKAYTDADRTRRRGEAYVSSSKGMLHHTEYLFYDALIAAQLHGTSTRLTRRKHKNKLIRIKNKLMKWAGGCEENFQVRAYIVQAETARLKNNFAEALLYYDKAAELAAIYGQHHLAGIAGRLSSELYARMGQKKAAMIYDNDSRKSFLKWGIAQGAEAENSDGNNFDVNTLIKASQAIAMEHDFSSLLKTLIQTVIENAGAQHGALLLEKDGRFMVQASADAERSTVEVMQDIDYRYIDTLVHPVINYVVRTKESIVINDMAQDKIFDTAYISERQVRSVFCAPLILQGELKGLIYLENNLLPAVFTADKVNLLQSLSGQIVISIENAIVYQDLEEKIKVRTKDLEETQKELKLLASTDPMTKLYNRRYFTEVSGHIFDLSRRESKDLSLIMLDIDHFKKINDTYGHKVGDSVIIALADLMQEHTRQSDIVCRFGGEEFMILLPDTNHDGAVQIAQKIREVVESGMLAIDDTTIAYTVSIGTTMVRHEKSSNFEVAISEVDRALYAAKNGGRNRVCSYAVHES
jgi:diguanylate cyclase (GGDEF)-like protein